MPKATVVEFSGHRRYCQRDRRGQVDAICSGDALVNWTVKNSGGKYRNAASLGPPEDDAIGFPQGDYRVVALAEPLRREINRRMANYTSGSSGTAKCRRRRALEQKAKNCPRRLRRLHAIGAQAGTRSETDPRHTDRVAARWGSTI